MIEQLEAMWHQLIDLMAFFIIPDWNDPISWLPWLLLIGVVGPLLTLVVLFWLRYVIVKPRVKTSFVETRRSAPLDADGKPVFPVGEPYCGRDRLIYEPGLTSCTECGDDLLVACPKCSLVRSAEIRTCGNCGLTFTLQPRTRQVTPAGPPPGGAAVA